MLTALKPLYQLSILTYFLKHFSLCTSGVFCLVLDTC